MRLQRDIKPASTKKAAPLVLTPIKGALLRFRIDYRKLDVVAKQGSQPIAGTDECIDSLGGAAVFFSLVASSSYYQVELKRQTVIKPHSRLIMDCAELYKRLLDCEMPQGRFNGRRTLYCSWCNGSLL